jgi:hypothetical protein
MAPSPVTPNDTCLIEFRNVGENQRAVTVSSSISASQAEEVKQRLERSWLIEKIKLYERNGCYSFQVYGRWTALYRKFLISKIEQVIMEQLGVSRGTSRVHYPLPGQSLHQPHRIKTRTFRAPITPSPEDIMELARPRFL